MTRLNANLMEMTSKEIDTTIKDVEQDTSSIEPSEIDKLLPLRELEGLDKQLRTIKGFIEVANPLFIIGTNAFKDIDRDWIAHLTVTHKTDFCFYLEIKKNCTLHIIFT